MKTTTAIESVLTDRQKPLGQHELCQVAAIESALSDVLYRTAVDFSGQYNSLGGANIARDGTDAVRYAVSEVRIRIRRYNRNQPHSDGPVVSIGSRICGDLKPVAAIEGVIRNVPDGVRQVDRLQ